MAADFVRFDEFELDLRAYQLRRSGRTLKLERIPMDVLCLLVERRGQLVTREEIIEKLWGKNVFLDTDNAINTAIRKIRQVLKDDPEQPRFVQTVTGRGYRFIAQVAGVGAPEIAEAISVQQKPVPSAGALGRYWKALESDCSRYRGCAGVAGGWLFLSSPRAKTHGQRHDCRLPTSATRRAIPCLTER